MKNNILEYIILYVIVAYAAVVIATLTRVFAVSIGFDGFTAFIVFLVVLASYSVSKHSCGIAKPDASLDRERIS